MGLTVGVDVGGTKVLAGVVDEQGRVVESVRAETPGESSEDLLDAIADVITRLRERHDVEAVGIGAAGFVDAERARVVFAPHLPWRDTPVRDLVGRKVADLPIVVENDANAAAWAEWRFGAGHGESHLVMITVGTGIGGGLVLGGALYRGRYGIAAEFGHITVEPRGRPCECGQEGCWEKYASGSALVALARERAAADRARAQRLLELAGGDPEAIEGTDVTRAAQDGDPVARECFQELGRSLGEGLASVAAMLDPGVIVIGGGVGEAGDLLLVPTTASFGAHLTGQGNRPLAELRLAELGNTAGLIGAADLARHR